MAQRRVIVPAEHIATTCEHLAVRTDDRQSRIEPCDVPVRPDDRTAITIPVLEQAGKKTLQDILDLEQEEVQAIAGMTPELAEKLMTFLNEMTEEGGEETPAPPETPPPAA